ncbi:non-muscle caldesmon isoform X2 [Acanthopagrus latus]|uniref:non-muscle caldesmon isoform X2 n=1 Tax=Acanthopagrus latus TaxID=8177 RepID=UPI00187CEDB3|nr:non-muscle caldesmon isoform X2 [Acanthopagrus latus]
MQVLLFCSSVSCSTHLSTCPPVHLSSAPELLASPRIPAEPQQTTASSFRPAVGPREAHKDAETLPRGRTCRSGTSGHSKRETRRRRRRRRVRRRRKEANMSNALLRRNSSKQGLQNLMRLTAQRSIEDAEEVERERRRRAREASRWSNGGSLPGDVSPESETPAEENMYDGDLKPNSSPSLEEDEGFSDWTQRRERRRQQRLQELSQGGEEDEEEEEVPINKAVKSVQASRLQRQEQVDRSKMEVETETERERRKEREEEAIRAERVRREKEREEEEKKRKSEEAMARRREEIQRPNTEVEKRKEVKISYTSKVVLQHEPKHNNAIRDATNEEVTSYVNKTRRSISRAKEPEEAQAILETEQRLEKIRLSLQQKESQELEQLRHRQAEAEQELEELKRRREDRRRVREEEERRREEEEQLRLAKEEEERTRMKRDIERRRMEAAERMKSLSMSSVDGDEMFSPISPKTPTHKITERTESLNRSLKKSNSFKKTQTLVLLPKIDDKMEQYAHAVESAQESRAVKASLSDLPSSPEVVASKKNLFEAGEAWSQSPTRGATCKDAEGLKVGVAGLITQWVKGPSDGSRQSLCRPTDVKPGDVMQKKNMWEGIRDSSGRTGQRSKTSAVGKKYKFVVTGHGKYEKIPVDDEDSQEFTNGKSDLYHDY